MSNSGSQEIDPKNHSKERERLRGASRRATMTDEQKEEANKKRRDAYHAKPANEKSARSERKREKNKTPSQLEGRRAYNKRMKFFRDTLTPSQWKALTLPLSLYSLLIIQLT